MYITHIYITHRYITNIYITNSNEQMTEDSSATRTDNDDEEANMPKGMAPTIGILHIYKYIYIYIYMCMCIYIYIYIYICVYICYVFKQPI